MSSLASKMMATGNKAASWVYRRSGGRIGGSVRGTPVGLLTVAGRNTGKPRSVPVASFEHGNGWLVVESAGGSDHDPQWFRNLRAARQARIQLGTAEHGVDVRITDDRERDDLWSEVVVEQAPGFAKYEAKTARVIPIAVLTPRH